MKNLIIILALLSLSLVHAQIQPKHTTVSTTSKSKHIDTKNFKELLQVSTFPNPIVKEMTVDFPDYGNYELFMYDLNGKMICKRKVSDNIQTTFDLTNLNSGFYTIVVIDRAHKKMAHIMIQKE